MILFVTPRLTRVTNLSVGMSRRKLPKLYTARQYAAKIGVKFSTFSRWLRQGRVPDAQLLPCGWIIPEGAMINVRGTDIAVPLEFIFGTIEPLEDPTYQERRGNPNGPSKRMVEAPGFLTVRKELGLTREEIREITGVGKDAQRRMERGKPVMTTTVRKAAKGLGVSVEDLLRKPMYVPEGYE